MTNDDARSPDASGTAEAVQRFGKADLQVHTSYGDGMASAIELFEHIEATTDLDVIAVTDHDDVGGALEAREAHARGRYSFELVTGIEVTTRSGHLLALWVDESIRSLRPFHETVAAIHDAGGLAVIPHPLSPLTRSIGRRTIERTLEIEDTSTRPDGIEVANTSLAGRVTSGKARRLNGARYGFAETGGSDAHFPEAVGTAWTLFSMRPGVSASESLREAVRTRQTAGDESRAPSLRELGAGRLLRQQVRGLSVTPRKVLGPPLRRVWALGRPSGS
ncbi:MAG: PHP-associated domain-containing protein [Dehalococcoidia bacterium]